MKKSVIRKETDALHQIAHASEAIRRKHQLIKLGKAGVEKAMSEALKPVTAPLEKLVAQSELEKTNKRRKKKHKKLDLSALPPLPPDDAYKTAVEDEENGARGDDEHLALRPQPSSSSQINESLTLSPTKYSSPMNKSTPVRAISSVKRLTPTSRTIRLEPPGEPQRSLHLYLQRLATDPDSLDQKYGVRTLKKGMKIGDTFVTFDNDTMHLGDQQFPLTLSLLELIFSKTPNMSLVTQIDRIDYGTMLRNTNAAHMYYRESEAIRDDPKFPKYVNIIKSLLGVEKGEEGGSKSGSSLPRHMIASRKRPRADYIYWDDPNELVNRLRLLMASQSAGNANHTNEIMAIIEELREADIIY